MKGIILAGGAGTRLFPLTQVASKQLLPVYDKPMIYYPLSALMLAGIRDIILISTPNDLPTFKRLLQDGSQWGIRIAYAEQAQPDGLAQAFTIAEEFLENGPACMILGDNFFYGNRLVQELRNAAQLDKGALIFGHRVNNPSTYGVLEFDDSKRVTNIVEKPPSPPSNYAIPGIYFVDRRAPGFVRKLKPSARGELEIVDLLKCYLDEGSLTVRSLGRGITWLDMGTPSSLLKASNFVEVIEQRQGHKIACLEEAAYVMKYISEKEMMSLTEIMGNGDYAQYLKDLIQNQSPF